jgi:hypothetical protein
MDRTKIAPPGQHPLDPSKPGIDAIAFALERVQTMILWIGEHQATFEANRTIDPNAADEELRNLADTTEQAAIHLYRLKELLLAGYCIDPNKRMPRGLEDSFFDKVVEGIIERRDSNA